MKAPSKPLSQRTKREICIFKLIFKAFFHGKASSFEEWPSSTLQHQLFPRRLFPLLLPSSAETGAMNNRLFSQPIIDGRRWRKEKRGGGGGRGRKSKREGRRTSLMTLFASKGGGGGMPKAHAFIFPMFVPLKSASKHANSSIAWQEMSITKEVLYLTHHPCPLSKRRRGGCNNEPISLWTWGGGGDAHSSCSLPKKILPPPQRIQKPGEEENDSWQPRAPLCPRPPPQPSCVRTTAHNHTTVWGGFLDHKA